MEIQVSPSAWQEIQMGSQESLHCKYTNPGGHPAVLDNGRPKNCWVGKTTSSIIHPWTWASGNSSSTWPRAGTAAAIGGNPWTGAASIKHGCQHTWAGWSYTASSSNHRKKCAASPITEKRHHRQVGSEGNSHSWRQDTVVQLLSRTHQ